MVKFHGIAWVLGLALIGCASSSPKSVEPRAVPVAIALDEDAADFEGCDLCARGEAGENLWCDECSVGFVGGQKIECEACFTGMSGGTAWCDECGKGYVDGEPAACKGCVLKAKGEASNCGGDA